MNEITNRILRNLNINISHNLDCDFLRLEIDELQNNVDVILGSTQLLDVQIYMSIYNAIKHTYGDRVNKLRLRYELENKHLNYYRKEEIFSYLSFFFQNSDMLSQILNDCNLNIIDNNLEIDSESKMLKLVDVTSAIEQVFKILDINCDNIIIKVEESNNLELIQKQVEKKIQKTVTSANFGTINPNIELVNIYEAKESLMPEQKVIIQGKAYGVELRSGTSKRGRDYTLLSFYIFDGNDAIKCSCFAGKQMPLEKLKIIKNNMVIKVQGIVKDDPYLNNQKSCDVTALEVILEQAPITNRSDEVENKRVELHLHTNLSTLSGISKIDDYAMLAKEFSHDTLAITDRDVVQSFVHGDRIKKDYGLKMVYGVEANVFTKPNIVENPIDINLKDAVYCVFDTETTGLSANFNKLIEIGAVKYQNGEIIDRFQQFIKIDEPLSEFISNLTSITDEDLSSGVDLRTGLENFLKWSKDTILVAHNATFDRQVMARNYERVLNKSFDMPIIDTLELSRFINYERTYHSLSQLSKLYKVPIDENAHHRADYDAQQLAYIFAKMLIQLEDLGITNLSELNTKNNIAHNRGMTNLIYVKNQKGLAPFYKIISDSLTTDFMINPRVNEENVLSVRENLIYVGGGGVDGSIVDAYLNKNDDEFRDIISKFDYIEIMPPSQYNTLIENNTFNDVSQIHTMLQTIINVSEELDKNVIATGNAYFTEPNLAIAKEMVISSSYGNYAINKDYSVDKKFLKDREKFDQWRQTNLSTIKDQYYKTTQEMLDEFSFLNDPEKYVVTNPKTLVNEIEEIQIIPDGLFTPKIEGVDEKVRDLVFSSARNIYGDKLPKLIEDRINKELESIIGYGYAIIYYISYKLVKYSNDNGYLVGSRGSVGSSVVAFFMGISEVNPIIPHYVCPNCHHIEFFEDGEVASGFDLEDKCCPECGVQMTHDGQNIPFETFLGFKGDKVPDIDLNFSGEFQGQAHEFVRSKDTLNDDELFDFDHAFRAGTIKSLAEKTAINAVKSYYRLLGEEADEALVKYYASFCTGVKQSTGQHPGGIIVIPQDKTVYDFTPIQYPANQKNSLWRTTHFDFNAIHDNVLKLDILGHDDPTMLKHLRDLTGIDPTTINVTDKKVLSLFINNESLNFQKDVDLDLGSLGLPEFGTETAMKLLRKAKPKSFADLVQVSGLSHGTGIWAGNAEDLIDSGTCTISEVIGCRDDIMSYLLLHNLPSKDAFNIMEKVRKGKGLSPEDEELMRANSVPDWYISSCKKIEYMFPKAHACAYVLMALRIGWYKVYHPVAYYCAYFSSRIDKFSVHSMIKGFEQIQIEYNQLLGDRKKKVSERLSQLSDEIIDEKLKCLNMSREMTARGFVFYPVDLNKSLASKFCMSENGDGLIIPFQAVDKLGEKEAMSIVAAREEKPFVSIADFRARTKVKSSSFEELKLIGVFDNLPEEGE